MDAAGRLGAAHAAVARGDPHGALRILAQAEAEGASAVDVHMARALALRVAGDVGGALDALDAAIAIEPYAWLAHLSRGALLEATGRPRVAAAAYRVALDTAPAAERLPASLQAPLSRARAAVAEQAEALRAHLRAAVAPVRARHAGADLTRFDAALDIYAGVAPPPEPPAGLPQRPLLLHYPGLAAAGFHGRERFAWLPELEGATAVVQRELQAVRALKADAFAPYIAYPPGAPVNQWGELNHSRRWSTLFLWRDGERQDAVCDACPETAALLARLPMQDQPGFAPTAMFSALEPQTTIPAHTGSSNTRLIVHLPLVLPGPARFRVGDETRPWRLREAWVFDDTVEHEAWNDADETRVVLIFDIWHPDLSAAERALVGAMMLAKNAWTAAEG